MTQEEKLLNKLFLKDFKETPSSAPHLKFLDLVMLLLQLWECWDLFPYKPHPASKDNFPDLHLK